MRNKQRYFRAAGYVFTWTNDATRAEVPLEMWRENPVTHERYWITRTTVAPDRHAAYARAMALVAWLQSLDVPVRKDPQAQAVLEQLAFLNERMKRVEAGNARFGVAIGQLLRGRAAAA